MVLESVCDNKICKVPEKSAYNIIIRDFKSEQSFVLKV